MSTYKSSAFSSSSSSEILFQQDSCIYKLIVGLHTGPAYTHMYNEMKNDRKKNKWNIKRKESSHWSQMFEMDSRADFRACRLEVDETSLGTELKSTIPLYSNECL